MSLEASATTISPQYMSLEYSTTTISPSTCHKSTVLLPLAPVDVTRVQNYYN